LNANTCRIWTIEKAQSVSSAKDKGCTLRDRADGLDDENANASSVRNAEAGDKASYDDNEDAHDGPCERTAR
jgi:hypothetical protein